MSSSQFPESAPSANPVFYRTYSRRGEHGRETWDEVCDRTIDGISEVGKFTPEEKDLVERMQRSLKCLPSGRWLWVGGTKWIEDPANSPGAFNCSYNEIYDWRSFGLQMELGMMGCGTGASLEERCISKLPAIRNKLNVTVIGSPGDVPEGDRIEDTKIGLTTGLLLNDKDEPVSLLSITVGDSRDGWVSAYQSFLRYSSEDLGECSEIDVEVDISNIRPKGAKLKGFGGVANPVLIKDLFPALAKILNGAVGRKLTAEECCLLIDTAAKVVVAGSIRRFAGIKLFDNTSPLLKLGLWKEVDGNWVIDSDRDALRMSNHTRVWKYRPTLEEITDAVRQQYYSGEGAILWAGEEIARANADLLNTPARKLQFLSVYEKSEEDAIAVLLECAREDGVFISAEELEHRINRVGLNPCFAPGTMVMTKDGHYPIEDLVGKTVDVWDGQHWVQVDNFRVTARNQPVYKIILESGEEIRATAYHKFILADGTRKELTALKTGDRLMSHSVMVHGEHSEKGAYLKGFLTGDGTSSGNKAILHLYRPKYVCIDRLVRSGLEIPVVVESLKNKGQYTATQEVGFSGEKEQRLKVMTGLSARPELVDWVTTHRRSFPYQSLNWDVLSKLEYIAGVLDSDGTASDSLHGFAYQVSSVHLEWLKGLQLLLKTIGVNSRLSLMKKGGVKDFGLRGGVCEIQPSYRLSIGQEDSIRLANLVDFSRLPSFAERKTVYSVKPRWNKVKAIELDGIEEKVYCCTVPTNHSFSLSNGIRTAQCGEIVGGAGFMCNLAEVHLNHIDPFNFQEQEDAFKAGALSVASLLNLRFTEPRVQQSRDFDPIVAVCFTGFFDFCVKAFGVDWLRWWQAGRPEDWRQDDDYVVVSDRNLLKFYSDEHVKLLVPQRILDYGSYVGTSLGLVYKRLEEAYLSEWSSIVHETVWEYCDRHNLKRPNRCTALQPSGTKSLLTGASPAWQPPKAQRFIRRITFGKNDPVALSCIDMGYSVVPSQSDKDENGRLLDDPFDPRCTEWLVEIPTEVSWASLPGVDEIEIEKFSALAQFDFCMQCQRHYVSHNVSSTIELREDEIEPLARRIHEAIQYDEGYISAALLARFEAPFPRLPFEKIDRPTFDRLHAEVMARRKTDDFYAALLEYDAAAGEVELKGPAGCDSDKCLLGGGPKG